MENEFFFFTLKLITVKPADVFLIRLEDPTYF